MSRSVAVPTQGTPFAELVREHERTLQGYALKLCGDRAEAADLVQDTLERALRRFERFEPGTNGRAWLCTILYNLFVDCQRKRRSQATAPFSDDVAAEPDEPFVAPRWTTISPEQLRAAMRQLDDEFRTVCELRLIERMSYVEIAERTGVPRNTVATRLLRAREKLKGLLERALEESR